MKHVKIALLFLLMRLFFAPSVSAQLASAVTVSPVIFNISLAPGKTHTYLLKLQNNLDSPVPLRVSVENLDLTRDDERTDTPLRSIAAWVDLPENNMIIEPAGKREIPFSVRVPDKIPLGGYYGMIYIQPFSPDSTADHKTNVSSKIGILLLGSVGVQEMPINKIQLLSPRTSRLIYEQKDIRLDFAVKNTALNHFSAKPFLRITSLFGQTQDVSVEEKIIFPGRTREWSVPLRLEHYPSLFYRAELAVSVGEGEQKTAVIYMAAFPLLRIVLAILGLLLCIIILRNRVQIKNAVRILIRG